MVYVCNSKKMVDTQNSEHVLRLQNLQVLCKTYLDAWKSGKVCCPHINCSSKNILFCSDGLSHHYRIQHSRDPCRRRNETRI